MEEEKSGITASVARIADRAARHGDVLRGEEAIKAVLVSPLLVALGHDPSDPDLVRVGVRSDNGRADYVVLHPEGGTAMLVAVVSNPDESESQRARQLLRMADDRPVAVLLTDGTRHRFHVLSDRALAPEPFLSMDLGDEIEEEVLAPLSRTAFDLDTAIDAARTTRPDALAWEVLVGGIEESRFRDALAMLLTSEGVTEKRAADAAANVLARVARVLRGEEEAVPPGQADGDDRARRALSGDEQAGLEIVRSIVGERVDGKRVEGRPAQSYLSVNLDRNNRRAVCRLYFTAQSTRHIGIFADGVETKHRINGYQDVASYRGAIMARLRELDPGAFRGDEDDASGAPEPVDAGERSPERHAAALAGDAVRTSSTPAPALEGASIEGDGRADAGTAPAPATAVPEEAGEPVRSDQSPPAPVADRFDDEADEDDMRERFHDDGPAAGDAAHGGEPSLV